MLNSGLRGLGLSTCLVTALWSHSASRAIPRVGTDKFHVGGNLAINKTSHPGKEEVQSNPFDMNNKKNRSEYSHYRDYLNSGFTWMRLTSLI